MFALVLALCCLLITVVSSGWAASPRPPTAKLAVYLKTEASQSVRALDSMKQELSRLMQTASYELEWRGPQDSHIDTGAFLAVVELRGDCEAPSGNFPAGSTLPRQHGGCANAACWAESFGGRSGELRSAVEFAGFQIFSRIAAKKPSHGSTPGNVRRQGPRVSEAGADEERSGQINSPSC